MLQGLINALRNTQELEELRQVAETTANYLDGLVELQAALNHLHQVSSDSLVHEDLDETQKGHRLGTIEVCEALLKMF